MANKQSEVRHYFIDEGGDSTLFSRGGRVLIGSKGCSRFFVLGLLDVPDPMALQYSLEDLRKQLLGNPYFRDVPSMQAEKRKTALAFHAKDDPVEIRWEVFKLLRAMRELRFFAVVADKRSVLEYVRRRNEDGSGYRYHPNDLYDSLVRRLLNEKLHKSDTYKIFFSRRGKSDRTLALREAIETARSQFAQKHGIAIGASLQVFEFSPSEQAGLQAVDYFTWAIQRLYERHEERYVRYLGEAVRVVLDIDDKRKTGAGKYYTRKSPISAARLAWRHEKEKPGI